MMLITIIMCTHSNVNTRVLSAAGVELHEVLCCSYIVCCLHVYCIVVSMLFVCYVLWDEQSINIKGVLVMCCVLYNGIP